MTSLGVTLPLLVYLLVCSCKSEYLYIACAFVLASEPRGPLCLHLLKGARRAISHGNRWTGELEGGGAGGAKKKKIGKESRLSPVINGGIPVWRGRREGQAGLRRGKTWIHWEKTQRVWHEEKADNYLYWLKPASQHRQDRKLWLDQ